MTCCMAVTAPRVRSCLGTLLCEVRSELSEGRRGRSGDHHPERAMATQKWESVSTGRRRAGLSQDHLGPVMTQQGLRDVHHRVGS